MAQIKEKKSTRAIKKKVDNKKERISTRILITFAVGVMLLILGYTVKKIVDCGVSDCYLGGVGAGSLIVSLIWLLVESLKP